MPAHFEIHVTDGARARAFYSGLFGWSFDPMPGAEDIDYHVVTGTDIGDGHALTCGMLKRMGDAPAPGSPVRGGTLTVEVEDVDERYSWALANGGSEALPPEFMPGVGRYAYVEDGEGNIVGMIKSDEGS